jgi:hypothetical protein
LSLSKEIRRRHKRFRDELALLLGLSVLGQPRPPVSLPPIFFEIDISYDYLAKHPDVLLVIENFPDMVKGLARKSEVSVPLDILPLTYGVLAKISPTGVIQFHEDLVSGKIPYREKGVTPDLLETLGYIPKLAISSKPFIIDVVIGKGRKASKGTIQLHEDLASGKIPYSGKGTTPELLETLGCVPKVAVTGLPYVLDAVIGHGRNSQKGIIQFYQDLVSGKIPYSGKGTTPELLETLGLIPKSVSESLDIFKTGFTPSGIGRKPEIIQSVETFLEDYSILARKPDIPLSLETFLEQYSTLVRKPDIPLSLETYLEGYSTKARKSDIAIVEDGVGLDGYDTSMILYHPHYITIFESIRVMDSLPASSVKKSNAVSLPTIDIPTSNVQKPVVGSMVEGFGLDTYSTTVNVITLQDPILRSGAVSPNDVILRHGGV